MSAPRSSSARAAAPASETSALGADFTRRVIDAMGPRTSSRLREVMAVLIAHLHDAAREVRLTNDELSAGIALLNRAGQMSNDHRDESQLLCDILGLESLVDDMTFRAQRGQAADLTASAILGPFWRADAPTRGYGCSISFDPPEDAQPVFMYGKVVDAATGEPLENASLDIWQASTNGLYEQQDPNQRDHNLRGVFKTDFRGHSALYCLRPTAYPIPRDGPAGQLLDLMDRNIFRPAHIHLRVCASNYRTLVKQIFDKDCAYLTNDAVFAVKDELEVQFLPRTGDARADLELEYNIKLAKSA